MGFWNGGEGEDDYSQQEDNVDEEICFEVGIVDVIFMGFGEREQFVKVVVGIGCIIKDIFNGYKE